jgi:hypothetical protein
LEHFDAPLDIVVADMEIVEVGYHLDMQNVHFSTGNGRSQHRNECEVQRHIITLNEDVLQGI